MEERRNIRIERFREHARESTSIEHRTLFEDVVASMERVPPEERQELLVRWERAAFYAQGLSSRGIVEYRTHLIPTPDIRTATRKVEKKANLSLFYQSGIFASAILTVSALGVTVSNIIATDLGIPIASALFGIFLAFSIEAIRFRKRTKRLA